MSIGDRPGRDYRRRAYEGEHPGPVRHRRSYPQPAAWACQEGWVVVYRGVANNVGEGELTVVIEDPAHGLNCDTPDPWLQIGELIVRGQSQSSARFARLEGDVAVLKTDVAVLKTDVAETKDRLTRFELATERRFNRVDAQLERLITLVQRDETKRS